MALRLMESFDGINSATYQKKWTTFVGGTLVAGRHGNGITDWSGSKAIANAQTILTGFAVRLPNLVGGVLAEIKDGSTVQLDLYVNPDNGKLSVRRGGTVVLGTSDVSVPVGSMAEIHLKAKIDNTTGTFEVRVNNANILSATGQDTQVSANAYGNLVSYPGIAGGQPTWDDLWIMDSSGSDNNDFPGNVRVAYVNPVGEGALNELTPSSGSSHFAMVDEAIPNDDTDYLYGATTGKYELFAFTDLTLTEVKAVQLLLRAKQEQAGAHTIKGALRISSTIYESAELTLSTDYETHQAIWGVSPATGVAFTGNELDGLQGGMDLYA
jgi:hypothetical protein